LTPRSRARRASSSNSRIFVMKVLSIYPDALPRVRS
jgi:hypothetical protein